MLSAQEALAAAREHAVPEPLVPLSVFRVLLRDGPVAKAMADLLVALLYRGTLDPRLRELVIMRIGWVTASVYEWTQHWRVATEMGMAPEDLLAVRDWRDSGLGETDRIILQATDETLAAGTIAPETWARLEALLPAGALVELPVVIGHWRMYSSLLRSLRIPLEDGVQPWPPDGREPGPVS